jgi:glycosyltransferase involved in cell wall biosynthesis
VFEVSHGGEEKYTLSLANWLTKKNIKVTIMGSTFAWIKSKRLHILEKKNVEKKNVEKKNNVKVIYPPYIIYLLSRFFLSLLWVFKIVIDNRKDKFTLIHAQDTGFSGLSAVIAGKILRIPVITASHGIRHKSLELIIKGKLKKILCKIEYEIDIFTVKHSNKVIVDSPNIENYFEKIVNKDIEFIPVPIKVKDFEFSISKRISLRNELGLSDSYTIICFIGRFSPEKNLLTLIEAFSKVSQKNPYLILVMVGAGILEVKIKNLIKEKGIENKVLFCGIRFDVDRFLCGSDIFVLPSFIEGMSTALLEAMAAGISIICSEIPGNRQLVSENEAIFVNPYKEYQLELAILNLSKDKHLRQKLGENAKRKILQYDEDIVFTNIIELYKSVLKK